MPLWPTGSVNKKQALLFWFGSCREKGENENNLIASNMSCRRMVSIDPNVEEFSNKYIRYFQCELWIFSHRFFFIVVVAFFVNFRVLFRLVKNKQVTCCLSSYRDNHHIGRIKQKKLMIIRAVDGICCISQIINYHFCCVLSSTFCFATCYRPNSSSEQIMGKEKINAKESSLFKIPIHNDSLFSKQRKAQSYRN